MRIATVISGWDTGSDWISYKMSNLLGEYEPVTPRRFVVAELHQNLQRSAATLVGQRSPACHVVDAQQQRARDVRQRLRVRLGAAHEVVKIRTRKALLDEKAQQQMGAHRWRGREDSKLVLPSE